MVFSFADLVGAAAVRMLHFPNMSSEPLRHVAAFFRSERGLAFTKAAMEAGALESEKPRVLCVTSNGAVLDTTPEALMQKEESAVVYCVDLSRLIASMVVVTTEGMEQDVDEAGPSGRVPRKPKAPVKVRTVRGKEVELLKTKTSRGKRT